MASEKNAIILDCDPGEDDALAILLALAREDLSLKALVCGFGNASADRTHSNGGGLLALARRTDVALFKGTGKPYLAHPLETETVSAGDFVGENGLCGTPLPAAPAVLLASARDAENVRLDALAAHVRAAGPLTYIVTGPCGTLAHILDRLGADARDCIREVIIMGGALDTPGNHGPINPETGKSYAEFNFYCDPHGVKRVFDSGLPVTLVSWDLTHRIVLSYAELPSWRGETPEGRFVADLMRNFLESYGNAHARAFEFNDCITITALERAGTLRDERVSIITDGEQAGRLVRDATGTPLKFFELAEQDIVPVRDDILNAIGVRTAA